MAFGQQKDKVGKKFHCHCRKKKKKMHHGDEEGKALSINLAE